MNGRSTRDVSAGVSGAADTWPLSARDAAAVLGISERTVRRAIGRGDLVAEKHGGVFRIDPGDIARLRGPSCPSPAPSAVAVRAIPTPADQLVTAGPQHDVERGWAESSDLSEELGRVLAAIHALTEPSSLREAREDPDRYLARQWAALTAAQQLCASSLAAGLCGLGKPTNSGGRRMLSGFEHGEVALTRREIDVLELVAMGESNREIARSLFISVPTVKRHLTNILGKLGASSRHEAALVARFRGLS